MEEMKKISGYFLNDPISMMVILTRNRVSLKSNNVHFLDVQSNRESF